MVFAEPDHEAVMHHQKPALLEAMEELELQESLNITAYEESVHQDAKTDRLIQIVPVYTELLQS